MKSKNILELFDEFLYLSWGRDKKKEQAEPLRDVELYSYVFLRKYKGDWMIEYLPVGTRLKIPAPWSSMWSEFFVWGGSQVQDWINSVREEEIKKSGLLYFCYTMFKILSYIEGEIYRVISDFETKWEEEITTIINLGTGEFRTWCKEEHNIILDPWIIENYEDGEKEI